MNILYSYRHIRQKKGEIPSTRNTRWFWKNRVRIGYCQKWSGRVSGTRQALVVEVWAELFFLAFASFFNRQTYLSVDVVIMRGGFLIGSAVAGSFKDKYICCIRKQILILCYIRSLYNEGKLQQMVKGVQHMSGTCRLPFTVYNLTGSEHFQMYLFWLKLYLFKLQNKFVWIWSI